MKRGGAKSAPSRASRSIRNAVRRTCATIPKRFLPTALFYSWSRSSSKPPPQSGPSHSRSTAVSHQARYEGEAWFLARPEHQPASIAPAIMRSGAAIATMLRDASSLAFPAFSLARSVEPVQAVAPNPAISAAENSKPEKRGLPVATRI